MGLNRLQSNYDLFSHNTANFILVGLTYLAIRRAALYFTTVCPARTLMHGKVVIVTGANCGIGYEAALDLARRHATVILACRDVTKADKAAQTIIKATGNNAVYVEKLDLASQKSVREFCDRIKQKQEKVDVLINNAGVMKCPFALTEDGFETHMAVNHFGNFLLTNLLRETLYKAGHSRVIFVSSSLHKFGKVDLSAINTGKQYDTGKPYSDSKLMNLLFARYLHKLHNNDGKLCVYSMHPGMVRTQLGRYSFFFNKLFRTLGLPLFMVLYPLYIFLVKSAREGCQTVVYLAVAPELEGESDGYYSNFKKELWSGPASHMELAKQVWSFSAEVTNLAC